MPYKLPEACKPSPEALAALRAARKKMEPPKIRGGLLIDPALQGVRVIGPKVLELQAEVDALRKEVAELRHALQRAGLLPPP